jgi:hypothetical protein
MAQSREDIQKVIASLREGDTVRVQWDDNGNLSTETGQVWDAPGTNFFGLGPDLLNPTDKELVGIKVTKRAPVSPPIRQPAVGAVAAGSAGSEESEEQPAANGSVAAAATRARRAAP